MATDADVMGGPEPDEEATDLLSGADPGETEDVLSSDESDEADGEESAEDEG